MTKREMTNWRLNAPENERQTNIWLAANAAVASVSVVAFLVIGIFGPLRPVASPVPSHATDISAAAKLPLADH